MASAQELGPGAPTTYEVVVPTYDVERTIAETLTSLTSQSLPPERILVADDETPDASAEIAAGFPEVEVRHFPHSGLSGVMNRALAEVQADAVAFVDADDVWHPDLGRLLLAAIVATDAASVSVNCELFPDGAHPELADPLPPVWNEIGYHDLLRKNQLWKSGTMSRTAALREVGGWREELPIIGDHDIALRLMEAGQTIFTTTWRGLGYRTSPANMSRDPAPTLTEQLQVALPRFEGDRAEGEAAGRSHARTLWLRTLAKASQDHRDLRDVPALSGLIPDVPAGQRGLELLVRSPLRYGLAAGWRTWSPR